MKWEEIKALIERCVPEELLVNYQMSIEVSNASANTNETRIEIDNNRCEILVTES